MNGHHHIKLPTLPDAAPAKRKPFAPGAKVFLKSCAVGIPGVVIGHARGRVHVNWPGWHFVGKYKPDRLMLIAEEEIKK